MANNYGSYGYQQNFPAAVSFDDDTTQSTALGCKRREEDKEYIYCKFVATDSSAGAKGIGVILKDEFYTVGKATANAPILGVTIAALDATQYAWVQYKGPAEVYASADCTATNLLGISSAGQFAPTAVQRTDGTSTTYNVAAVAIDTWNAGTAIRGTAYINGIA